MRVSVCRAAVEHHPTWTLRVSTIPPRVCRPVPIAGGSPTNLDTAPFPARARYRGRRETPTSVPESSGKSAASFGLRRRPSARRHAAHGSSEGAPHGPCHPRLRDHGRAGPRRRRASLYKGPARQLNVLPCNDWPRLCHARGRRPRRGRGDRLHLHRADPPSARRRAWLSSWSSSPAAASTSSSTEPSAAGAGGTPGRAAGVASPRPIGWGSSIATLPGNILLAADGTLKITDFGLAKAVGSEGLTRGGQGLAKDAPEQAGAGPRRLARRPISAVGPV